MSRIGDWMQTYTGVQFWPLDPRPEEINLQDIAHSLANQCRFAGHCTEFYSVAEHCVRVCEIVPDQDKAWGLLHDAAEAYLVDLPRPVKYHSSVGDAYRSMERTLFSSIHARFGLIGCDPDSVIEADNILLMTEKRDLMPNSPAKWRETSAPLNSIIVPWAPVVARGEFLRIAAQLGIR